MSFFNQPSREEMERDYDKLYGKIYSKIQWIYGAAILVFYFFPALSYSDLFSFSIFTVGYWYITMALASMFGNKERGTSITNYYNEKNGVELRLILMYKEGEDVSEGLYPTWIKSRDYGLTAQTQANITGCILGFSALLFFKTPFTGIGVFVATFLSYMIAQKQLIKFLCKGVYRPSYYNYMPKEEANAMNASERESFRLETKFADEISQKKHIEAFKKEIEEEEEDTSNSEDDNEPPESPPSPPSLKR